MSQKFLIWFIASVVTVLSAYYQRVTGPTYPSSGSVVFRGQKISYSFDRSHAGESDASVRILLPDTSAAATLCWRRYKVFEEWSESAMKREGEFLTGQLPWQPPAGKLIYFVRLYDESEVTTLPAHEPVVIRFRGDVPALVLIPHIIIMFGAMLFSIRAGLEAFSESPRFRGLVLLTVAFFVLGGLILGPLVQKSAFDSYWTGWPIGTDMTDNKTVVACILWIVAAFGLRSEKRKRFWIFLASLVTLLVFLIPHSIFGSEIDYTRSREGSKVVILVPGKTPTQRFDGSRLHEGRIEAHI
jgi:hypothetical protein